MLQALPPATTSTLLPLKMSRNTRAIWIWNVAFVLRFAGTPSLTVLRASKKDLELGGHMASYQSSATFYEVCFNHFFRARTEKDGGDLVYFQVTSLRAYMHVRSWKAV